MIESDFKPFYRVTWWLQGSSVAQYADHLERETATEHYARLQNSPGVETVALDVITRLAKTVREQEKEAR